ILLLAGDVEINPGPTPMDISSPETQQSAQPTQLAQTLANVSTTAATSHVSLAPCAGNWVATATSASAKVTTTIHLDSTVIPWAPATAFTITSLVLTVGGRSVTAAVQVASLVTITQA
ncbi:hypothetical protein ABVT39_013423, partial [Epinephelus coioides]